MGVKFLRQDLSLVSWTKTKGIPVTERKSGRPMLEDMGFFALKGIILEKVPHGSGWLSHHLRYSYQGDHEDQVWSCVRPWACVY